jgi:filamentous hemagglutinin family protein
MLFYSSNPVVLAGPEGAQVVHGQVSFQQSGQNTVITASDKSIVNYSGFDIAPSEMVQFIQPGSYASVLNRILSANPTNIDGTLLANGRVFFVNPAGVMIGAGASINVNQLVASGLNMTNENFLNGRYEFAGGSGAVANFGDISAESVYLIGKQVTNAGTISCPDGYVVMASCDRVLLGQPGSDVVVEVDMPQAEALDTGGVINEGTIDAPGGQIVLAAGDMFSTAVTNQGAVSAAGGTVTVKAAAVEQLGAISVDGVEGDAGNVMLTASETVTLGSGSVTTANAGANGDGGEVVVAAGEMAVLSDGARIEAKGGAESGNGGFVEISGEHFVFAGDVDTSAANGKMGTLLLDPANITIKDGDGTNSADMVFEKQLEDQASSIVLSASESIVMEDLSDNMLDLRTDGKSIEMIIELEAAADEFVSDGYVKFEDKEDTIATTTGDIFIQGGSGAENDGVGIDIGNLETGSPNPHVASGSIGLITYSGGDISTGHLNALGGSEAEILVSSAGDLTIFGDEPHGAAVAWTNLVPDKAADDTSAEVCLEAAGDIEIDYSVEAHSIAKVKTVSDVHICADGSVDVDTRNGNILAWAETPQGGIAEALIRVHAADSISITDNSGNFKPPIRARADAKDLKADLIVLPGEEFDGFDGEGDDAYAHALIEIEDEYDTSQCEDCIPRLIPPPPPDEFAPIAIDDLAETDVGITIIIDVLGNDTDFYGILLSGATVAEFSQLASGMGTLILNPDGTFTYIPPDSLAELFDESGQWHDMFTYFVRDADGLVSDNPALVFITVNAKQVPPGPKPKPGPEPEPRPQIPAAPLPQPIVWEVAGCPALMDWLAEELGIEADKVQVTLLHAYSKTQRAATNRSAIGYKADIQWCEVCAKLRNAATILADAEGTGMAALAESFGVLAPPDAPFTEEMAASVLTAFEDAREGAQYATANEYADAFATYVALLDAELGSPVDDSQTFVMTKYGSSIADSDNSNIGAFVMWRLQALAGQ